MSRRNISITEEKLKKMVKSGKGKGERDKYQPFLTVLDVSSKGISPRKPGYKVKRMMEYLSRQEKKYYFMLEWADKVIDIREQYPLLDENDSIEETKDIAMELGVRYPKAKPGEIHVMTTDFLVTILIDREKKLLARTIKPIDKLNKRTIEKFEIERIYWERRGVDFKIVTEEQLSDILYTNIEFFYFQKYGFIERIGWSTIVDVEESLRNHLGEKISNVIKMIDIEKGLEKGTSLAVFKFLIANKYWEIDMLSESLIELENIKITRINKLERRDNE